MTPDMKLTTFPAPILRKKAAKVEKINDPIKKLLDEMVQIMYLHNGVGLAAVQVGIDKQLAVVDVGQGVIKMVNPVITKCKGSDCQEEGCLSVPGTIVKVKRAKSIEAIFMNEEGEVLSIEADGILARAIQHEVDHLGGKLIIDYLNPIKKLIARARGRKSTTSDRKIRK